MADLLEGMNQFGTNSEKFQFMVDKVAEMLGAALVGIWLEKGGNLVPVAVGGRAKEWRILDTLSCRPGGPDADEPEVRAFRERRPAVRKPRGAEPGGRKRLALGARLAVPLQYDHHVFGVIGLAVIEGKELTPPMRHALSVLAPVVSMMVREERDLLLLGERSKDLATLISAVQVLGRVKSEEELMTEFGDIAIQVLGANGGYILLRGNGDWSKLKMFGLLSGAAEMAPLVGELARQPPGRPRPSVRPAVYIRNDSEWPWSILEELGFKSGISGQLVVENELAGIFTLWSREPDFFNRKQEVLRALAVEASIALELLWVRNQLVAGAHTDPLTGLANRTGLQQRLEELVAHGRRHGDSFLFVLMDLDHFKEFNDSRGHPEGDRLLRGVGESLRYSVRPFDVAARLGGDEFVVVMAHCNFDTPGVRERVREMLVRLTVGLEVGVSAGVACYPEDGEEFRSLYRAADLRLYEAKRLGRGRIGWPSGRVDRITGS
ncbi:MAG: diguanylate cyclase [Alicyclobacillaceae bacterium]|nr:diguanylate cyclase [Alicyclobacillaceae bacterium]